MKSKRPQQKTRREKRRFKKKTLVVIISSLIIIGTFIYAMNHSYFRFKTVDVVGQKTIIEEDVRISVASYLDHKILGLIPRNNILFMNAHALEKHLQEEFTKIEDLQVTTHNAEKIIINIGERSVHSLWCITRDYESEFDQECYFSDAFGLLYARAPYFSGNVYQKIFINPIYEIDAENEKKEITYIGSSISVVDSFSDFFDFIDSLEDQFPFTTGTVIFRDFNDVEIEINRLGTQIYAQKQKPIVRYNQETSYEIISRDVAIILDFASFKKDFTSRPAALESIDVRFDNRALYTFTPEIIE